MMELRRLKLGQPQAEQQIRLLEDW